MSSTRTQDLLFGIFKDDDDPIGVIRAKTLKALQTLEDELLKEKEDIKKKTFAQARDIVGAVLAKAKDPNSAYGLQNAYAILSHNAEAAPDVPVLLQDLRKGYAVFVSILETLGLALGKEVAQEHLERIDAALTLAGVDPVRRPTKRKSHKTLE